VSFPTQGQGLTGFPPDAAASSGMKLPFVMAGLDPPIQTFVITGLDPVIQKPDWIASSFHSSQ
jgi:hypothetical protein